MSGQVDAASEGVNRKRVRSASVPFSYETGGSMSWLGKLRRLLKSLATPPTPPATEWINLEFLSCSARKLVATTTKLPQPTTNPFGFKSPGILKFELFTRQGKILTKHSFCRSNEEINPDRPGLQIIWIL